MRRGDARARSRALPIDDRRHVRASLRDKVRVLLVDGDPIANIRVLQDKSRILAIMKDGQFHKAPKMSEQRRRMSA